MPPAALLTGLNGATDPFGIISGVPYQYVKEVMPQVSVLKLGMVHPLPEKMIEDFAGQVDRLIVVEELEPVIEDQIKAWGIPVEGKELFSLLGNTVRNSSKVCLRESAMKISMVCKRNSSPASSALSGCPTRGYSTP